MGNRMFVSLLAAVGLLLAMPAEVRGQDTRVVELDIPAQPLESALQQVADRMKLQLLYSASDLKGLAVKPLRGRFSTREAIERLLEGTGLTASFDGGTAVAIKPKPTVPTRSSEAAPAGAVRGEVITVVGTNIRGVRPASSPFEIYSAEDIERTGATTTEQFIQKLPQNFGSRNQFANNNDPTDESTRNRDGIAGVDLRGLGTGTTLTLLNGRRLAASSFGRVVDISLIPLAAVARVEVLTDGASAIYGSDAIGGVVNFVLKKDFDGAETRVAYGGVTSGNLRQADFSQALGRNWASGNALLAFNALSAEPLQRFDRAYARPAGAGTLTPNDRRYNLLATLSQDIGSRLSVAGDVALTRRHIKSENTTLLFSAIGFPAFDSFVRYKSDTDLYFGNLGLTWRAASWLDASMEASYSKVVLASEAVTLNFNANPQTTSTFQNGRKDATLDLTGKLEASLFDLPAGKLRATAGGGVLDNDYKSQTALTGQVSNRVFGRKTSYAFAEAFAPLVGPAQGTAFAHRVELSLAARYTSYEDTSSPRLVQDFGSDVDPKVGLLWAPLEGLAFRGTYGSSFRAPALSQLDPTGVAVGSVSRNPVVAGVPANVVSTSVLPAPDLQPETAKTFTLGFDLRPKARATFRLSGTYYKIDYRNRIARPPSGLDVFTNPERYPDTIYRPSSVDFLLRAFGDAPFATSVPTACPGIPLTDRRAIATCLFALPNLWFQDQRYRNLALSEQHGVDLAISDKFTTPWAEVTLGANITRILGYDQQGNTTSPIISAINGVGKPVDLRARVYAGFSRNGVDATLGVNYVDGYPNAAPVGRVSRWVTADLSLAYAFGRSGPRLLDGVRATLSVQNLFDKNPPFVNFTGLFFDQIGFDSTNANPLGRLIVAGITKRW